MQDISSGLASFKDGLSKGRDVCDLQEEWSLVIDKIVEKLFVGHEDLRVAILALGGFGRREMSPYSDVDLLFLYDGQLEPVSSMVNSILYPMWDKGLEAGGATRTLRDCKDMFAGDIKAQTAMLDARFIAGNSALADEFFSLVQEKMGNKKWRKNFVKAKYKEHILRLKKFGGTLYLLEPHIKEGEGGLREFQTATWLTKILEMTEPDNAEIKFVREIRARLHFLSSKRDDRLTFEKQKMVADSLMISIDELMSRYYKCATVIHEETNDVLLFASPRRIRMARKWNEGRIKKIVGERPSWQRLVANSDVLASALKMLHRSGGLMEFIPEFASIYCKAQPGAYHIYTVDQHSILTVKKILDLSKTGPRLARAVYKKIKSKDILFLAALLHDIGKRPNKIESHAELGADIALGVAKNHGYSEKDASKISFLVRSHLLMPRIAFSRDLADLDMMERFANSLQSIELLDMLFIITYADIAAIGPETWTSWKEKLLDELYLGTRKLLSGLGLKNVHRDIDKIKKRLSAGSLREAATNLLDNMPDRYFIANTEADIRRHVAMYSVFEAYHVITQHFPHKNHSEFVIMTRDAPGIFLRITGVMAANSANILEAELNTGRNGVVLDVLRVQNLRGGPLNSKKRDKIISDLETVFAKGGNVEALIKKLPTGLKKRGMDEKTRIEIDNEVSADSTVIDIYTSDRIGLLYDITNAFHKKGCYIALAKVLTQADRVKDSFYLREVGGGKIVLPEKLEMIEESVKGAI